MVKRKPSEAAQARTKARLKKELEAKRKAEQEAREAFEAGRKANADIPLLKPPVLGERDGVLIDVRWCLKEKDGAVVEEHRIAGQWRYDPAMGRKICLQCFSGGYPLCPPNPCTICKTNNWHERPKWLGGSWICGTCHPRLPPEDVERSKPSWADEMEKMWDGSLRRTTEGGER